MQYWNRGVVYKQIGKFEKSLGDYTKAIELDGKFTNAYLNRAEIYKKLEQTSAALKDFDTAIELNPNYAEAYNNCGVLHHALGDVNRAIENFNSAIRLKPNFAEALNNRGVANKNIGRLEDARMDYELALQLKPFYPESHHNLSYIKKYKSVDSQIREMGKWLDNEKANNTDRIYLSFALAKAYDDLGDSDRSFNYLEKANRLRKKEFNYTTSTDIQLMDNIKKLFSSDPFYENTITAKSTKRPVFIIGMPRSGTSLIEQILSSHSQVYGCGELNYMGKLAIRELSKWSRHIDTKEEASDQLEGKYSIGSDYMETIGKLNFSESVFTDKMPINFQWLGFILRSFPDAKIVHVTRDPRATCWSIYKTHFSSQGNRFGYDLEDLAAYYQLYIDLMNFWRERFPNAIYDICYEDLTENQEEKTRQLLSYCDLDWQPQCLEFHKSKRIVKTASALQVRQPMYKGSSESWKKYEDQLQPLLFGLGYH